MGLSFLGFSCKGLCWVNADPPGPLYYGELNRRGFSPIALSWLQTNCKLGQSVKAQIQKYSKGTHYRFIMFCIIETFSLYYIITRFADPHGGPVNRVAILPQGPFFWKCISSENTVSKELSYSQKSIWECVYSVGIYSQVFRDDIFFKVLAPLIPRSVYRRSPSPGK